MARYAVYHDEESRTSVITRVAEVYPEGTLRAVYAGSDKITIQHRASTQKVVGPLHFQRYERKDGTGFVTSSEALTYLEAELEKRHVEHDVCWTGSNW